MSGQEGGEGEAKAAYDMRPYYHPTPEAATKTATPPGTAVTAIPRSRPNQAGVPSQNTQIVRNRSQTRRGQKQTNTGHTVNLTEQENPPTQRPQRSITRTRRALEIIENNAQLTQSGDQQMDIDLDMEA
ncbi:hypothetical protein T440DRAFT_523543 [Plenodomus tracheiphilus IPT5]|uniref:Uncharacterized protein n=1 Tax=Plenodomus tracheiphilus IPT5 TaxID=1408161 RepID=A0A6A7AQD2_9PLEO|nr:hypothetical protein T440DRAFT_523543 [Plenodomus tracheiphilus IPT5]